MAIRQTLELTWVGKHHNNPIEHRLLTARPGLSYGSPTAASRLIIGDNLHALAALQADYAGHISCIYIDPPYNTGQDFTTYDDGLEHSSWLTMMRDRLDLMRPLLTPDGLIFVQLDDNEMAYLTVLMDEIFGRANRLNTIAVKMSEATGVKMAHAQRRLPKQKEYILVYKRGGAPLLTPLQVPREAWNEEYKSVVLGVDRATLDTVKDMLEAGASTADDIARVNALLAEATMVPLAAYFQERAIARDRQDSWRWENAWRIVQAVGAGSLKARAAVARRPQAISAVLSARGKLSIFKSDFDDSARDPRFRILFADKYLTTNPGDFWSDIKTTGGVGEEGGVSMPKGKKPEALLARILSLCTKPGDLVLDAFAGSGTTGAVAHKMGRPWIMIEQGAQALTHIVPRLRAVVDGRDASGVTQTAGWRGGGGFQVFDVAPALAVRDGPGGALINEKPVPRSGERPQDDES